MEELKWYENSSLESIRNTIRSNIQTVSMSFNAIGYYLKNVRDRNLHKEAGYSSILEFAHAEFGISESWANRWMDINDRFSVDCNSPILQERYKEYKSSILAEMLTLTDQQIERITLTTTRAEIRNMKKPELKVIAPAQVENEIDQKKPEAGTIIYAVSGNGKISKYEVVSKYCSFSEKYFTVKDKEGAIHNLSAESEHWHNTKEDAKKDSWYHEKESKPKALESVTESPNIVTEELENVTETAEIVTEMVETEIISIECVADQESEIVEAEVIETESWDELSLAKEILARKHEQLNSWLRIKDPSTGEKKSIEKVKVEVGALAAYITDPDNIVNSIPKPEQPELPILKNNDQRKEFIDAYETWPVWINQAETGERYHRYDLTDKVAIVVKVSRKHGWEHYKETKDYIYGAEQYYLLGVKSEWSQKGSKFMEDDSRTFYECNTNKSALTEYLKEFQKKGV